jgi:hypothetical protein
MGTRARFELGECSENSVKKSDLLCRWLPAVRTFVKSSILLADSRYLAFENTHSDDINSNLIGLVLRRSGQLQASLLELTGDHTAFKSSYAVTWQERLHPECTRNRVATASLRKNRRGSVKRISGKLCSVYGADPSLWFEMSDF